MNCAISGVSFISLTHQQFNIGHFWLRRGLQLVQLTPYLRPSRVQLLNLLLQLSFLRFLFANLSTKCAKLILRILLLLFQRFYIIF
jgi:hypothetical protein